MLFPPVRRSERLFPSPFRRGTVRTTNGRGFFIGMKKQIRDALSGREIRHNESRFPGKMIEKNHMRHYIIFFPSINFI